MQAEYANIRMSTPNTKQNKYVSSTGNHCLKDLYELQSVYHLLKGSHILGRTVCAGP